MWSAFMNGSGTHGGGGAGGGYVPSQGWEFVPCSGMDRADRGRGKSRSPARRISSPPTVFSHIYDSQRDGGDAAAQLEVLRGPMWPGLEPQQQQQQQQHTRLKKKFEDLKKRHVQDKEEWMREKESLLREVADIQGGENRRILLELKSVLEEVQVEVKREEEKRSELQLQYTRDRCAWELEKAELKCRIAQLEARECAGFLGGGGGVHSAAAGSGSGSAAALRGAPRQNGETSTLRREREEQRRLLADTHSTAMDLRCRLEINERGWMREKAELLQRFDLERKEWESQLEDMQRKIETLYCDVRTNREVKGGGRPDDGGDGVHGLGVHGLGVRSASAGSSLLSDSEPDASFSGAPQKNVSNGHENNVRVRPEEKPLWAEPNHGDKKKNTTALNAALKEIARVSEELCSYQDEIRKKSADKRNRSESLCLSEGSEPASGRDGTRLQVDEEEAPCDLGQIYDELRALERENWIASLTKSTWRADFAEAESHGDAKTSPGSLWDIDAADGPPVPPRSSSWTLSSPTDTELHIPESPVMMARACHSPCAHIDKKCSSSPSIVRKFEAMLQENEGKVLIDGVVASRLAPPASSDSVSKGCCHARWSCDASKFTNKLSAYGTVQKSFSEVNILTAAKGSRSDYCPRNPELQIPQLVTELPLDLLLSSLETPPAGCDLQGSRRNITLEQKTAEFNRTLFQAEMGRGVEQSDGCAATDADSPGSQPAFSPTGAPLEIIQPGEATFQPLCADVASPLSTSNSRIPPPEVQSGQTGSGAEGQEVGMKRGIPPELPSEQPQTMTAMTSQSPARHCEVEHRGQTASGPPSRKAQPRAAAEVLFSEPVLPGWSAGGSDFFENENPRGAKPQPARAGVSVQQQPSVENKHGQKTPPAHQTQPRLAPVLPPSQPDSSSRTGPRAMSEHPWKALTLAAYPRPEGSRSNYGAVERILRNYESAARAQQNQSRPNGTDCRPDTGAGPAAEEDAPEPDAPGIDPMRHAQTATHTQLSGAVAELHLTEEEKTGVTSASSSSSSFSSSSAQKNFSRPARPARRRLPSRWAGRSPTSSSVSSSSPSASSSFALHKHGSSFSYSHAFHIETVII
ncbi:protein SOGA3a isoform X2 [Clinocottus analis]|uniref:protein SOGA3a isoform X2 n=1 Tax=Clinocottus analis TaxID=304258 RepID=UPI0035C12403